MLILEHPCTLKRSFFSVHIQTLMCLYTPVPIMRSKNSFLIVCWTNVLSSIYLSNVPCSASTEFLLSTFSTFCSLSSGTGVETGGAGVEAEEGDEEAALEAWVASATASAATTAFFSPSSSSAFSPLSSTLSSILSSLSSSAVSVWWLEDPQSVSRLI